MPQNSNFADPIMCKGSLQV